MKAITIADLADVGSGTALRDRSTTQVLNRIGRIHRAVHGGNVTQETVRMLLTELNTQVGEIERRIHDPSSREDSKPTWSKGLPKP